MSSNSTLDTFAQKVIAQSPTVLVESYADLCAAVLLLYDYFLTLPLELRYVWRGKTNAMKTLFVLNRYISLLFLYSQVSLNFIKAERNMECRVFYYFQEITSLLNAFAVFGIFTLRTYAIYGRSKAVLFLLAVPALVGLSSFIWEIVTQTAFAYPPELKICPLTCNFNTSTSLNAGLRAACFIRSAFHPILADVANFASTVVFDALVVTLTVCRAGRLALQSRKANISGSLSFILARDGVVYYSAIFVLQFVIVALSAIVLKTGSTNLADVSDALGRINNVLQIILINRLILNLSHAANSSDDSEFRTRTGLEPPTFAVGPVLSNIGGAIRTLPDDLDDNTFDTDKVASVNDTQSKAIKLSDLSEAECLNGADGSSSHPVIDITSLDCRDGCGSGRAAYE